MSRRHNCPKRGRHAKSRYPERLAKRGLKATPAMEDADDLRKRQDRRVEPWMSDEESDTQRAALRRPPAAWS